MVCGSSRNANASPRCWRPRNGLSRRANPIWAPTPVPRSRADTPARDWAARCESENAAVIRACAPAAAHLTCSNAPSTSTRATSSFGQTAAKTATKPRSTSASDSRGSAGSIRGLSGWSEEGVFTRSSLLEHVFEYKDPSCVAPVLLPDLRTRRVGTLPACGRAGSGGVAGCLHRVGTAASSTGTDVVMVAAKPTSTVHPPSRLGSVNSPRRRRCSAHDRRDHEQHRHREHGRHEDGVSSDHLCAPVPRRVHEDVLGRRKGREHSHRDQARRVQT